MISTNEFIFYSLSFVKAYLSWYLNLICYANKAVKHDVALLFIK